MRYSVCAREFWPCSWDEEGTGGLKAIRHFDTRLEASEWVLGGCPGALQEQSVWVDGMNRVPVTPSSVELTADEAEALNARDKLAKFRWFTKNAYIVSGILEAPEMYPQLKNWDEDPRWPEPDRAALAAAKAKLESVWGPR